MIAEKQEGVNRKIKKNGVCALCPIWEILCRILEKGHIIVKVHKMQMENK